MIVSATCTNPQTGFRAANGGFTFSRKASLTGERLIVPCGHCRHCVAQKVAEWGLRVSLEAKMHDANCFITPTYRDEDLPPFGSLRMADLSAFMKRLRHRIAQPVRFFGCGEYGPKTLRPHYHSALFGFDFPDKIPAGKNARGDVYYSSKLLDELWGHGHCVLGNLTPESGRYIAGYVLKKFDKPMPEEFYAEFTNPATGEVLQRERECYRMSRRPGIGAAFFEKYESDFFPSDFVVHEGQKLAVPRYFRKRLKGRYELPGSDPDGAFGLDDHGVLARERLRFSRSRAAIRDQQPDRLAVKDELLKLNLDRLNRDFEGAGAL